MSEPIVSFCIPTFNRGRYLDSLLGSLVGLLADFPYSYEVFVGDNASDDNTTEVLAKYADWPALRVVRHDANLGGGANWQYLLTHARGKYFLYVADDDCILAPEVANAIQVLETLPHVGAAYAPWRMLDLVKDKDLGQFYSLEEDVLVQQGDFARLLEILLANRIFPEIGIYRRTTLLAVMPRVNEQAFYAFVHAAEFVQHGDVIFMKDPFYVAITNYFADHVRQQVGGVEVEYAWDRYRGGLEHVLGRAMSQITPQQRLDFIIRIQDMITERMGVAVRMRVYNQRDPIETYYLAYRLRGLGGEKFLPVNLSHLAMTAAVEFLTRDKDLNKGILRLVCFGNVAPTVRSLIEARSTVPVVYVSDIESLKKLDDSDLLFLLKQHQNLEIPSECRARLMHEGTLVNKFAA